MSKLIFYIIEYPKQTIHFFDNDEDAKRKETKLFIEYGPKKVHGEFFGTSDALDDLLSNLPPYPIQWKTLNSYYGTVWWAEKWSNGTLQFKIAGRYKELLAYKNREGWKIRKKIFVPYEQYKGGM
ncbi:MAG: hypothetical protein OEL89_00520 [Candidatus Peregrinibacteria bacterium]|nr:hypothetical protein [Candidatus Peregrinibacteria bacterium]